MRHHAIVEPAQTLEPMYRVRCVECGVLSDYGPLLWWSEDAARAVARAHERTEGELPEVGQ